MILSTVFKNATNKTPNDWTWNMFRLRFWTEWVHITPIDRALESIHNEYRLPGGLLNEIKSARDYQQSFDPLTSLPYLDSYTEVNREYLLKHGYSLFESSVLSEANGSVPDFKKDSNRLLVLKHEERPSDSNEQLANDMLEISPHLPQLTASESANRLILKKGEDGRYDLTIQRTEVKPTTYMELVRAVPAHMKMVPFMETPVHFNLVPFDEVVKAGFDMNDEQVEGKARNLQLSIWLTLFFVLAFCFFAVNSVAKFIIVTIVTSEVQFSYLMTSMYLTLLSAFTSFIYFHYLHLYWQYDTNRFGSVYSFLVAIKKDPMRLLPLSNKAEVNHV